MKDGLDSFTDLELSVASASLVGIPGIDLFVSDLTLVQSTSTSVASLDFSVLGFSFAVPLTATHTTALDVSVHGGLVDRGLRLGGGFGACLEAGGTGGGLWVRRRRCWSRSPALRSFVGVGGSLSADHKSVVAGTVGICASGVSLRFASVKDGSIASPTSSSRSRRPRWSGSPASTCSSRDLTLVQSTSTSVASIDFSVLGFIVRGAVDGDAHDLARCRLHGRLVDRRLRECGRLAHVSKQSVTGGGLSGAQTALLVEITGASLFVGVGGSLSADHKSVVAGTVGICASGVSLRFASVKDGLDSFTDLELSVAAPRWSGSPGSTCSSRI